MMLKILRNVIGVTFGATAVVASAFPDHLQLALAIPIRLARDISTVTLVVSGMNIIEHSSFIYLP
jgi:hypothetical protein